jgi:acyl-CoA synthetase (AMP-forming)/AMP-acid ligase II
MTPAAQAAAEQDHAAMVEQPFGLVTDMIRLCAVARPHSPALIKDGEVLTYGGLDALMDRVAASLQRDGVKPGEAISICAGSSIAYAVTFLGGLRAGVAVAPLAPSSTPESLAIMLADCAAKRFFLDQSTAKAMEGIALTMPLTRLDGSDGGQAFTEWLAPAGAVAAPVTIDPLDPFNIIYSSGTTGAPKGIVQSHEMRWSHASRGSTLGYGPGSVALLSTPLYSNTTLVSFFPSMAMGGAAVLMDRFDALGFLNLAQTHKVTHAMLVPVQYRRILEVPTFDDFDLSSFQMKFCTSAPFAAVLKADILKRWPGGLIEYFGMTEGGGSCMLVAHEHPDKLHTVGQPIPGHDVRLIDEEGRELPAGEVGEIVGRSAAMMNGYHNQPGKTADAEWVSPEGLRYIRTGDVGRFDAEGFLTLMDRKKDMIISGGFNIYPSDLESVVVGHPAVLEVAVVGALSDRWGETPVAFVTLKPGAEASADEIRAWANAKLGKTQRLAALKLLDVLPRSAIGKVLKRELRDQFMAQETVD